MTRRFRYLTLLVIISTLAWVPSAPAAIVWSWSIDNPSVISLPEDIVTIQGTLFNDISSETISELDVNAPNEVIDISLSSFSVDPALFENYTNDSGPLGAETFRSQFAGVVIEPGEAYSFILYTLVPKLGGAASGQYEIVSNSLALFASNQGFVQGGSVQVQVVPLPQSLALFVVGLVALARRPGFAPNKSVERSLDRSFPSLPLRSVAVTCRSPHR